MRIRRNDDTRFLFSIELFSGRPAPLLITGMVNELHSDLRLEHCNDLRSDIMRLLRQLSYAIKNQLKAPKACY